MTNDLFLLERAKQLDPIALRELHQEFYPLVARYVQFKVSDAQVVEDLVGEVFVRILEGLRRGQGWKETPRGWIMGIARNIVADYYRQQTKAPEIPLPETLPSTEESDPLFQTVLNERKQKLLHAMAILTEDQREIVTLRFLKGLDIRDIAAATGKTPGAVKALQHRALRILAERLEQLRSQN